MPPSSSAPPRRRTRRATGRWTPTPPCPSTDWPRRSATTTGACRSSRSRVACSGSWAVSRSAYWTSVINYPLNIGGRPLNSWVSFSIPTYETTILLAALATAGSMLAINGLPQHYHPVFNVEAFRKTASSTGFFLCIEATDPRFDLARARAFLEGLHPKAINEVNP